MRRFFDTLTSLVPIVVLLLAGAASGEIKLSHNTDMGLLCPLKLTLSPGGGESGWYRVAISKDGKQKKTEEKNDLSVGEWTEFKKPLTVTLAPQADRVYTVDYYSVSTSGARSATSQKTYRIYRFDNPLPKSKLDDLRAHGIASERNIIHDHFDSAAMGPKPEEADQFGPCSVGFNVYLPEDYNNNADKTKRYPVVYYLHGGRGNENALLPELVNVQHAIETKLIPPMIYVMAQGGSGGWFYHDHCRSNSRVMMDTCITRELIGAVESRYRVRRDPGGRAIQGFSMGGFGALKYAMLPPTNLFSSVVVFSPGLDGMGNGLSQAQIDAGITDHNLEISDLVKRHRDQLATMGIFLTHGVKGKELITIFKGTDVLVDQFRQLGIPCTFYELNTGHGQSASWKLKGDEALRFIAAHFK